MNFDHPVDSIGELINGLIEELGENPEDERAWVLCGALHYLKRDYGNAYACYLEAHKLDSMDLNILLKLGMISYQAGELQKAEKWLKEYFESGGSALSNWEPYYFYALILQKRNKLQEAIELLEKGKNRAKSILIDLLLTELLYKEQRYEEAIESIQELLKQDNKAEYWFFLFKCQYELGYQDLASHSLRQFLQIEPNFQLEETWGSLIGFTIHASNKIELRKTIAEVEERVLLQKEIGEFEKLKSLYQSDTEKSYDEKLNKILEKLKDN